MARVKSPLVLRIPSTSFPGSSLGWEVPCWVRWLAQIIRTKQRWLSESRPFRRGEASKLGAFRCWGPPSLSSPGQTNTFGRVLDLQISTVVPWLGLKRPSVLASSASSTPLRTHNILWSNKIHYGDSYAQEPSVTSCMVPRESTKCPVCKTRQQKGPQILPKSSC